MSLTISHLQQLYQGYLNTPELWRTNTLMELQQFQSSLQNTSKFRRSIDKPLRLGQLAEQFVFNQLEQTDGCTILAENIQIQKEKLTLGELDALIELDEAHIHLEIVYKFYLYDASLGDSEIERWIGPNRNDSCIEKITKLKRKQLPLLYTSECQSALENIELNPTMFQQQILFKAQLFIPYNTSVVLEELNQDCLRGFYINKEQLEDFKSFKFYIPSKLDWLLEPHQNVDWISYSNVIDEAKHFLEKKKSPIVWIKTFETKIHKCFLVWW